MHERQQQSLTEPAAAAGSGRADHDSRQPAKAKRFQPMCGDCGVVRGFSGGGGSGLLPDERLDCGGDCGGRMGQINNDRMDWRINNDGVFNNDKGHADMSDMSTLGTGGQIIATMPRRTAKTHRQERSDHHFSRLTQPG